MDVGLPGAVSDVVEDLLSIAALLPDARLAGATPLWEWIGEGATVFSYQCA